MSINELLSTYELSLYQIRELRKRFETPLTDLIRYVSNLYTRKIVIFYKLKIVL